MTFTSIDLPFSLTVEIVFSGKFSLRFIASCAAEIPLSAALFWSTFISYWSYVCDKSDLTFVMPLISVIIFSTRLTVSFIALVLGPLTVTSTELLPAPVPKS